MLVLNNVEVRYERVILVLQGMSLQVPAGQIVALLGANGAGKTTTLKAISGLLRSENGEISDGTIEYQGERINGRPPEEIVQKGIFQVMEGRHVFEHLTVEENLIAGSYTRRDRQNVRGDLELVYHYFPRLVPLRRNKAGYLSGGEQQMVAIGRALMARPKLVRLDEPSLGLAPLLVQEIFAIVQRLNREVGTTFLLVEQTARMALRISHYGYVMENGKIVLEGPTERLLENEDVKEFYLGLTELGRKSYRQVKAYKRRKRWLG